MKDHKGDRRRREDHGELDRLFSQADRYLCDDNLCGADESLKAAGQRAAAMWGEVGGAAAPPHVRLLIGLICQLREDLRHPGRHPPRMLRKDLRELRSRFQIEDRREAPEGAFP